MLAYTKKKVGDTTSMLPFVPVTTLTPPRNRSIAADGERGERCERLFARHDATDFMRKQGEQTWEAANDAGGGAAEWGDDCEEGGDSSGLRACCGYCNHVFHRRQ